MEGPRGAVIISRMSMQARIARHIAFAVVVSLVFSALVLVVFRHRFLRESMEESARTFAELISAPMAGWADYYSTSGSGLLDRQVTALRSLNRDVVQLDVVRVDGRVVMSSGPDGLVAFVRRGESPEVSKPDLLQALQNLEPSATRIDDATFGHVYRVVAPAIEAWGQHRYSLVATFSYDSVDRQLRHSLLLSALVLALGLVLTQRVSVVLAGGITRDLDRLRAGVQRIQEGHLDEQVAVRSQDEIQELAEAFNRMAEELLATIERLRAANRELESLDQTKADLIANVSHELKTPLTALRGYLELLVDGNLGELSGEAARAAEVCQKNVRRLSFRIEELVQVSRLDHMSALELTQEELDLPGVLNAVLDTFRPRLQDGGISAGLDVDPNLPSVQANREQIERVFLNLLDNAVKFTARGGTVLVTAEACDSEGRPGALVRVSDSGVGIPASELHRVFDRFHQVDPSLRRRFGGMGLGLSLVQSIVESHYGKVWVESEEDVGSTFFVWLPSRNTDFLDRAGEEASARIDSESAPGKAGQEAS